MEWRESAGRSRLAHPDAPRSRPGIFIRDRKAYGLEGELDLAVVVTLVPDHVLKQEDGVVVVEVHGPARFGP